MNQHYNDAINRIDMPMRFLKLPVDERGYPVPKFVQWVNGKPDFRCVDSRWLRRAVEFKLCWLCGEKLGCHFAFVIGPMCAINRINSEPPSHLECAKFAVRACPFLAYPQRKRDTANYPQGSVPAPGIPIERNPGTILIWITKTYQLFKTQRGTAPGGILFLLGEPIRWSWWHRGRPATREEILSSINSGLPLLRKLAEEEGVDAITEFERQIARGMALVPGEEVV